MKNLRMATGRVFSVPSYVALAGALALFAFLVAVWLPNVGLLAQVVADPGAPLAATIGLAFRLLGGIATNFSLLAAGYTVAIAVLFGVVTAMVGYLVRQRHLAAARQSIAIGSGATLTGVLGIGCATCGSLVLGVLAPALATSGALAALPLEGEEFGIASVALLLASLLLVSKSIAESSACPLRVGGGAQGHAHAHSTHAEGTI